MKKIAIVGCGIMGAGMARNFLAKGFAVYVWNRTKANAQSLMDLGAVWMETPALAAASADVVFEVTADDASSKSVWFGEEGIFAGSDSTKSLIVSATISAAWVDELAVSCQTKGLNFFDAALTGGRVGAETGQLTLLLGGDKVKLDALQDVFSAISKKVFHFGKVGSGMRYKLILNMLQAIHIVGLGEALKIATAQGMNLESVGEALCERPGGITTNIAWEGFKNHAEKLTFSVDWITKDLGYAKDLAGLLDLPLLDDVLVKYMQTVEKGKGQSDWTAVIVE